MTPNEFSSDLKVIGKSQISFAKSIGKRQETVSRWATGQLPIPEYVDVILQLAKQVVELEGKLEAVGVGEAAGAEIDVEKSRRLDVIVVQPLPQKGGGVGFIAFAPGLPACVGDGWTAAEAVADLEKAVADYEGAMERRGRK